MNHSAPPSSKDLSEATRQRVPLKLDTKTELTESHHPRGRLSLLSTFQSTFCASASSAYHVWSSTACDGTAHRKYPVDTFSQVSCPDPLLQNVIFKNLQQESRCGWISLSVCVLNLCAKITENEGCDLAIWQHGDAHRRTNHCAYCSRPLVFTWRWTCLSRDTRRTIAMSNVLLRANYALLLASDVFAPIFPPIVATYAHQCVSCSRSIAFVRDSMSSWTSWLTKLPRSM
jgi:hypothetical protein